MWEFFWEQKQQKGQNSKEERHDCYLLILRVA